MAFKDRYGDTQIKKGKVDNLSINWDADVIDVENCSKNSRYPVLLYTPWMEETKNHYHIALTRAEAKKLRNWLTEFLKR
jgi:hypothetical protein